MGNGMMAPVSCRMANSWRRYLDVGDRWIRGKSENSRSRSGGKVGDRKKLFLFGEYEGGVTGERPLLLEFQMISRQLKKQASRQIRKRLFQRCRAQRGKKKLPYWDRTLSNTVLIAHD